jgi:adenylate cyclase
VAEPRPRASRPERPLLLGALALIAATAAVTLHRTGRELPGLEAFERRLLDLRFRMRGTRAPGPEAAIVTFDDATLAEEPRLYEKRDGMAQVIRALKAAGARVIGIDALFSDAERVLPEPLVRDLDAYLTAHPTAASEADALLRRVHAETEGDAHLAAALKEAGNVVLGLHMGVSHDGRLAPAASLAHGKYGQSVRGPYEPRRALEVIASLPELNEAARALGIVTVFEDEGHTLRELPMVRGYEGGYYAPLAVALLAAYEGLSRGALVYDGSRRTVRVGERTVALAGDDALLLNFRGPPGTFPTYSVLDVVRGKLPPGALAGKIVILGFSFLGSDFTRSPFGTGFRGVEMHATALDNLLRGDPLRRASFWTDGLASLLVGLVILLLFWPRLELGPLAQSLGSLVVVCAWLVLSQYLFQSRGLWLSWMGPLFVAATVLVASLIASYAREGLQRRRLRHAFSHYLADGVIQELLADPAALQLGGARRHLTVLFSDIRDFTSFSERIPPEQLAKVLNTYLTPMTRAVLANAGFLDKFIGDAVMAVFGAPVANPDHPSHALRCALRMHEELAALKPTIAQLGVQIEIGIGINSGDMVVGNMGSEEHFNYTVMGDAVNLSSRLEGLTKTYGVFCLAGEETRQKASAEFRFRELDLVQVKGKSEPVAIHELLSGPGVEVARYAQLERFSDGVAAYRAGRFPEARAAFEAFAAANPGDKAAPLYLSRLTELGDLPPDGWRGVWVFKTK